MKKLPAESPVTKPVRISSDTHHLLKMVAAYRKTSITALISEIVDPVAGEMEVRERQARIEKVKKRSQGR